MEQCKLQLQKFNINNTNCVNTEFSSYFKNQAQNTYNLIYFDGNHSKKATLEYFDLLLQTVTNESVWIFDDIHWSEDMEDAWESIKSHPKVTITIDTFQWGIVFFRKEQEKENFIINPFMLQIHKIFHYFCTGQAIVNVQLLPLLNIQDV